MADKVRLDVLLAQRDLVRSRERAKRLIMAGEVTVDGRLVTKVGTRVPEDANITLKQKPPFVSRGGEKLAGALEHFEIDPTGWVCADVGASTGGFTDCLLQNGAAKVYAIDVGYGQLAWKLRQDDRVVVMERENARYLEHLPEPIDFVVADTSFISITYLLPVFASWLTPEGQAVVLIKPQFEAGKEQVGKGGVVRDPEVHRQVIEEVIAFAQEHDYRAKGVVLSSKVGPAGNVEFLLWLDRAGPPTDPAITAQWAREAVEAAHPPDQEA